TLKMPAFEWVHVQLHQQKGMISLSPPTICNSAIKTEKCVPIHLSVRTHPPFILRRQKTTPILMKLLIKKLAQCLQNKLE
ncbi:hypothetical protein ACRW07_26295, partial [Escherichia coli]